MVLWKNDGSRREGGWAWIGAGMRLAASTPFPPGVDVIDTGSSWILKDPFWYVTLARREVGRGDPQGLAPDRPQIACRRRKGVVTFAKAYLW